MINEDQLDGLITSAIDTLAQDSPNKSAECLQELAYVWATAGMTKKSFIDMRKYIIDEAMQKTSALFISEKLKSAEQLLQEQRNGTRVII